MTDIEKIKEELKREILEELKNNSASRKSVPALEKVKAKWFYGPDARNRYNGSLMDQLFGNPEQHRIWDAVRLLVRIIFCKKSTVGLSDVDQEKLERVCDSLCKCIYSLKDEVREELPMKNSEALKKGLKALGYEGTVKCIPCGYMRDTIIVNDRKVGIWDYQKETFVD